MDILRHLSPRNTQPCLIFPGRVLSYAELSAAVDETAARFGGARRLIALEARASADFVIAYLAALRGGHAMALLPPGNGAAAEAFIEDFRPSLALSQSAEGWQSRAPEGGPQPQLHPDLCVMLATSGSEGRPRWVRLSRANLDANAASIASYLALTPDDRAAQVLPFHYSYGLSVLNAQLAAGGSIAFCGESVIEPGFLPMAEQLGSTLLSGVPYSYELLERLNFRDRLWPALRIMTVAGGRLQPDLVTRYDAAMKAKGGAFFVMYGQTEATARMAYVPPDSLPHHADCIGIAIPGGRFRIDAEDGRTITAAGQAGELIYSGPNVMMGYAETAADLARGPERGELATGDIASFTADGLIRLEGRQKRFSKIAGLRIGHEALEWALRSKGFDAAVTGTDAAITLHIAGNTFAGAQALAARTAGIPERYIEVKRIDTLPRLASGKIDYRALAASPEARAEEPSEDLLEAFRAALYPRPVTGADSFESLEGDSLAYVQASLAVEKRLGELPDGWESMSIAALESRARKAAPHATPRNGLGPIESHIVLRALAILLIVVHHATLWPIPGGAAALMLLVGYGLARFHREALFQGRGQAVLLPMLRNLLPYGVVLLGYALAWETVPWASLLLAGNLGFADPAQKTMLPFQFWFVEAYAQLCLAVAALFAVPAARKAITRHPFAWGLAFVFFAFALRYAVPLLYDIGGRKIFLLSYVLWLPAMGWCACLAETRWQKRLLLLAAALLCPFAAYTGGNWQGSWILYMLQFAVLVVLLEVPQFRLPRLAIPAVMMISAASYHIYLFHRIVPELLGLDGMGPSGILASIAVGLVSGIGAAALQRRLFARMGGSLPLLPRMARLFR